MFARYHYLALLALALSKLQESQASSSYDNNNSNSAAQQPDITAFAFVRKTASETAADDAPNDSHQDFPSRNSDESSEDSSTTVSSSLLYDGGCVVSAEALMCTGGDDGYDSSIFSLMDFGADDYSDEEESDDEDDDDDDGHSSMLSNASLRRSKVAAGYNAPPPPRDSQSTKYEDTSSSQVSWSQLNNLQRMQSYEIPFQATTTAFYNGNTLSLRGGAAAVSWSLKHYQTKQSYTIPFPTTTPAFVNSGALLLRGGAAASSVGSEFAKKLLVTALVTLVYEALCGHILEFIKIYMQTSPDGTSYGTVLRQITAEKGIGGLWDGFIPWGVVQSFFKGSVFGLAHAMASSCLVPLAESGTIPMQLAMTCAGGIAGGFQGFVLSPTLLLKTRVMTNPVFREKMSLWKTTWLSATTGYDVVASEGVGALMKGSSVFATKRVFDWATRYYFSDLFETMALSYKGGAALTVQDKIACSLLGGTASTFCTLPLDVLVAKIQDAKKAGVSVSALKLFQDELKEKGWAGLKKSYMKGFEARLAHVAFTTVAIKTGTPIAYNLLFPAKLEAATAS
ncbi:whole genome shotgun sequence [Seminavis robusta]|uniref:Whole genome shotgun sequence n=1 Tax=Seminavis robusta TaxID=568900 RepID=A0A9N8HRN6_9STRA|nr:whole genome shotgun sequence [Seminavis robusta]|eukprot:Sro1292_g260000.1 whole genome shotgun sequence (566) ;mRNA; f:11663-13360